MLQSLAAGGATLVLVTHQLAEGLALATHLAVMRDGRFVRQESRAGVDAAAYLVRYRELVTNGA
jgi:heme exporter protein A